MAGAADLIHAQAAAGQPQDRADHEQGSVAAALDSILQLMHAMLLEDSNDCAQLWRHVLASLTAGVVRRPSSTSQRSFQNNLSTVALCCKHCAPTF